MFAIALVLAFATTTAVAERSTVDVSEKSDSEWNPDDPTTYEEFVEEIEKSREKCDRVKRCFRKEHRRIRKMINSYMVQKTLGRNAIRQLYRLMKKRLR